MRQLATVREIEEVKDIPEADRIQAYRVDGWWVVDQKGKYSPGDMVIYVEVDSWLPHEIAPFLSKGKEPREFEGIKGERLKTVKMKGQISQGLLLPIDLVKEVPDHIYVCDVIKGVDVTEKLGIVKYEKPMPAQLAGTAKGNFPSFIPKTDQERIQNLTKYMETFQEKVWEVTEKLNGTSMTVYNYQGEVGVCSRNLDLKENDENSYWHVVKRDSIDEKLKNLENMAIQGELIGPGIQGNPYKLDQLEFFVFDIYDIVLAEYFAPGVRHDDCWDLELRHVPIWSDYCLIKDNNMDDLLELAEGKSLLNENTQREGLVFKEFVRGRPSFKIISNKYLLKGGE